MAFYKLIDDVLHCGPNYIHAPGYSLISEQHETYTYPVDGWYWFGTASEAQAALLPTANGYPVSGITKLAFRNRFTQGEKVAIEIAQLDNTAASMPARAQAAALRASQGDLLVASFIDLQRPDTRDGVHILETAGLLASGRALEILDAPIRPSERPT